MHFQTPGQPVELQRVIELLHLVTCRHLVNLAVTERAVHSLPVILHSWQENGWKLSFSRTAMVFIWVLRKDRNNLVSTHCFENERLATAPAVSRFIRHS